MRAAFWRKIHDLVYPERAAEPGVSLTFQQEAIDSNMRTARWMVLLLGPLHLCTIVAFVFFQKSDPARADWLVWVLGINATLLAVSILGACVAWRSIPALLVPWIGDIGGAVYLLGGAAMSANAQRGNPNVNLFILGAFFIGFRMRMRPLVFTTTLLSGSALVLAGMLHFRTETVMRAADALTVASVALMSQMAFLLTRRSRFREVVARCQIQQLNAQLNERVRERSLELSVALSRLAEGHQSLVPGAVLGGRVELAEPLGRGGMGIVYRGRDLLTGEAVAVKVVQAGSAGELDGLHRFLREVQILTSVSHPAIVRSLHVDVSEDGRLFQVMELVHGETLDTCIARGGPLQPLSVARLGAVLASALAAAHEARVIHLDVKPANIILTRAVPGLKLLDFGISALRDARAIDPGVDGRIFGTPEFMAPELVGDPKMVDERADVYALGLVLYLAATGQMPFSATTPPAWILAHTMHPPKDIREHAPEVPESLADIVMACLRKTPAERPSATEIASALDALAALGGLGPLETLSLVPPETSGVVSDVRPALASSSETQRSPELTSA